MNFHWYSSIVILIVLPNFKITMGAQWSKMNFSDVVQSYGYPVEIHEVTTEDGYLLDVFRVPYGAKSSTKTPNPNPILLNHGLMGSAENFIVGGPTKALAYVLADKGYDIWLCNARGTQHSRKHVHLDPDKDLEQYWRFSFHEIGVYDLPATIDYVLNKTGKSQLHFIGHSQGTTTFFVMGSERPEYNEKIKLMIAMAPSALLGNIKMISLRLLATFKDYLKTLADYLKVYELIPKYLLSNEAIRSITSSFCEEHQVITRTVCSNVFVAMSGFSPEQLDPDTITFLTNLGPGGASVYQALHYAQLVNSGKFVKFDWGPRENMIKYNSTTPPEYNFANMVSPMSLFYGEADLMVTKEDVMLLTTRLPNVVDVYRIPYDNWSHLDFLWARDMDKYLNPHIFRILRKYK
ncbi:hypothetical protein ABEB36_002670 [Hypothenemus hampei]|uniref:Lipase n=1 Tax=Hypothenemus hampei TaxID=57062 RepID=A0ABD1F6K6_HYPHA